MFSRRVVPDLGNYAQEIDTKPHTRSITYLAMPKKKVGGCAISTKTGTKSYPVENKHFRHPRECCTYLRAWGRHTSSPKNPEVRPSLVHCVIHRCAPVTNVIHETLVMEVTSSNPVISIFFPVLSLRSCIVQCIFHQLSRFVAECAWPP